MATPRQRKVLFHQAAPSYLLWDTFPDPRAAGAVDGTRAWPGPGVRTVVDTGNVASIANGVFTVSGNTSAGDPRLDEGSFVRAFGRVFLLTTDDLSNQELFFGLSNNATPSATTGAPYFKSTGTTLRVVSTSGTARTIGVQADYTRYAVVARAIDGYLFGRLAAGGWRLLSIEAVDSTATILPAVVCAVKTGALFSLDDWKTPDILWVVPCLAYDTFTRADGALGTSEFTGPDGQAAPVRTWTGATWTIASNKAVNTPTAGAELLTDGGLENWASATNLTSWTEQLNGTSTVNQDAGVFHGGANAARLDIDASNSLVGIAQAITAAANSWLQLQAWVRGSDTAPIAAFDLNAGDPATHALTATYALKTQTVRTATANPTVRYRRAGSSGASKSLYIDDCTVKVLTLSSLIASCQDLGTPDVLASADLVLTAGTQAGLVTNLDSAASPANFLLAYHNGSNALLDKCVGSTYTNLISVAATYSASATLRLITYTSGGNLMARLYYANALIGSEQTISDAGIVTNKIHGMFDTYSTGNTIDNFTIFARGTEGHYNVLDTF